MLILEPKSRIFLIVIFSFWCVTDKNLAKRWLTLTGQPLPGGKQMTILNNLGWGILKNLRYGCCVDNS